jgi:hypothetical protein
MALAAGWVELRLPLFVCRLTLKTIHCLILIPKLDTPIYPIGVPDEIHLERHQIGVEQFLEMLRFDQRIRPGELPGIGK